MRGRMFVLQEKLLACPLVHIAQAAAIPVGINYRRKRLSLPGTNGLELMG